jgi:geranylgeranyl reductase family protein
MENCDVLVVGGGPAGSSCARRLRHHGLDVVVMDRSAFPRDKVCAGWITPQVLEDIELDVHDYRKGRTFQPIVGFRTGVIGGDADIETRYERPVSFGIRRCEFDQYLLEHSGSRLKLGTPVSSIRRDGGQWVINECVRAGMLVGAGGHFCPVARHLNQGLQGAPIVVAQEAEFAVDSGDTTSWQGSGDMPELYFCREAKGYGWYFRKEQFVNVGFGLLNGRSLPKATEEFVAFLRKRGRIPETSWRWRGHAYLVSEAPRRRAFDAGVVLIGDAAGIAYPQSGEGIRPAIESGLLAASAIVEARGRYSADQLATYEHRLRRRFGGTRKRPEWSKSIVDVLGARLLPTLLGNPWFTRHMVLDRWFLNARQPSLAVS